MDEWEEACEGVCDRESIGDRGGDVDEGEEGGDGVGNSIKGELGVVCHCMKGGLGVSESAKGGLGVIDSMQGGLGVGKSAKGRRGAGKSKKGGLGVGNSVKGGLCVVNTLKNELEVGDLMERDVMVGEVGVSEFIDGGLQVREQEGLAVGGKCVNEFASMRSSLVSSRSLSCKRWLLARFDTR